MKTQATHREPTGRENLREKAQIGRPDRHNPYPRPNLVALAGPSQLNFDIILQRLKRVALTKQSAHSDLAGRTGSRNQLRSRQRWSSLVK